MCERGKPWTRSASVYVLLCKLDHFQCGNINESQVFIFNVACVKVILSSATLCRAVSPSSRLESVSLDCTAPRTFGSRPPTPRHRGRSLGRSVGRASTHYAAPCPPSARRPRTPRIALSQSPSLSVSLPLSLSLRWFGFHSVTTKVQSCTRESEPYFKVEVTFDRKLVLFPRGAVLIRSKQHAYFVIHLKSGFVYLATDPLEFQHLLISEMASMRWACISFSSTGRYYVLFNAESSCWLPRSQLPLRRRGMELYTFIRHLRKSQNGF